MDRFRRVRTRPRVSPPGRREAEPLAAAVHAHRFPRLGPGLCVLPPVARARPGQGVPRPAARASPHRRGPPGGADRGNHRCAVGEGCRVGALRLMRVRRRQEDQRIEAARDRGQSRPAADALGHSGRWHRPRRRSQHAAPTGRPSSYACPAGRSWSERRQALSRTRSSQAPRCRVSRSAQAPDVSGGPASGRTYCGTGVESLPSSSGSIRSAPRADRRQALTVTHSSRSAGGSPRLFSAG